MEFLSLKHDRVLFVDADEVITPELKNELKNLDWCADGYFIKGQPVWNGRPLANGLWNNKLALLDRRKFKFPIVDDLDIPGGNELEGHYQPVGIGPVTVGQLIYSMIHDCQRGWEKRHENYARWEAGMMARQGFPPDPVARREMLKKIFRQMPFRGPAMFLYSYVFKNGWRDGEAGLDYARAKAKYYRAINYHRHR